MKDGISIEQVYTLLWLRLFEDFIHMLFCVTLYRRRKEKQAMSRIQEVEEDVENGAVMRNDGSQWDVSVKERAKDR
jgi:hypothetical protein